MESTLGPGASTYSNICLCYKVSWVSSRSRISFTAVVSSSGLYASLVLRSEGVERLSGLPSDKEEKICALTQTRVFLTDDATLGSFLYPLRLCMSDEHRKAAAESSQGRLPIGLLQRRACPTCRIG